MRATAALPLTTVERCLVTTRPAKRHHTLPYLTLPYPIILNLTLPSSTVQCLAHPTSKASAGAAKCEVIVIDASTGGVAPQLREYQAYCPTLGFYRLSTSVWQPHLDPASSNSSNMLKIFWSSAFIFSLDTYLNYKLWQLRRGSQNTTFDTTGQTAPNLPLRCL